MDEVDRKGAVNVAFGVEGGEANLPGDEASTLELEGGVSKVDVVAVFGLVAERRPCDDRGIGNGKSSSSTGTSDTVLEVASEVVVVVVGKVKGDEGLGGGIGTTSGDGEGEGAGELEAIRAAEGSDVVAAGWVVDIEERMDIGGDAVPMGDILAGGTSHNSDDNNADEESERTRT